MEGLKSGAMELIPDKDVYDVEKRDTKKRFLTTDAICAVCGTIINSNYEDDCFICDDGDKTCDHHDFITGRQSVDLRILLDFRIEDLKALAELHGCSDGGGRTKTVAGLMKKLYANLLDTRINDVLIRKIVMRNRKKFWFWKDIDSAMSKARKPKGIALVSAEECVEIKEITIKNKKDEIVKVTVMPLKSELDRKGR
jgi:hypothetical protein